MATGQREWNNNAVHVNTVYAAANLRPPFRDGPTGRHGSIAIRSPVTRAGNIEHLIIHSRDGARVSFMQSDDGNHGYQDYEICKNIERYPRTTLKIDTNL